MALVEAMRMVMRWSTVSLSPAEICFQMSAIECSRKARAERIPTSAKARSVCTPALSRSGLFLPPGILVVPTSTKLSSAPLAMPSPMPAARGEGRCPGNLVAVVALARLAPGAGAPGQCRARIVAEDRLGHGKLEIGGRHGAAAGLAQAPGGAGVGARDGLDDMEEGNRIGLDSVRRARQQHAEQPRLVELVQKRRRQPALVLDFVRRRLDGRPQHLATGDHHRL